MTDQLPTTTSYNVPAYLQGAEPTGLETVSQNRATPRIKIVQSQSSRDLRNDYPDGSIILTPTLQIVAPCLEGARGMDREAMSQAFAAVPIFHYETFEVWSDFDDEASPMVEHVEYRRDNETARRAMNPNLREEPYGDGYTRQYVHGLNYLLYIESGPAAGEIAAWSYNKGDFAIGKNFNSALMRRNVPIFANRFNFWAVGRATKRYNWIGLAFGDPADEIGPFVPDADQYERFKELHEQFQQLFASGTMRVAEHDAEADVNDTD
jgi:hypothetical protein